MKSTLLCALLLAALPAVQAQTPRAARGGRAALAPRAVAPRAAVAAARPALPIRRVILYSNGVAYIERRGLVSGRAEIDLSFKQSQVDDVLKSMVVLDLGEGRVGAVSYNSSAPPAARMADIPFSIGAETRDGVSGGLAGVLSQLQGAHVVVHTARGAASGSVLTVEERRTPQADPAKPPVRAYALVIAAASGELMSFDLAEVRSVRLADEGTRRDIGEFAAAAASARRRDAKTITVTSDGAGTREMLVSYTIAAPIWKTTYRVVLDAEGQPFFQGWAIVDNVSEEDWEDVRLSLISGTPVSFIQPIQKPFYRYRPVVPVPDDLRLAPQIYEPDTGETNGGGQITGAVEDPNGAAAAGATVTVTSQATGQPVATVMTDSDGRFRTPLVGPGRYTVTVELPGFKRTVVEAVVTPTRAARLDIELDVAGVTETVTVTADSSSSSLTANSVNDLPLLARGAVGAVNNFSIAAAVAGGDSGVEAAAAGEEVGDLFEYQIAQPVTVRRDRSALIPILQTRMEGERVSVFNEAARRTRPMSGMLLKNTSPLTLEDGALTVIDGSAYAGESLLERLKPGEQRLVSFALDLGTLVTVRDEDEPESDGPVYRVSILNGVLRTHYHDRERKTYTFMNQTDKPRTVYVEHPVREDWELDERETPQPEGRSARFYRFRVALGPRETARLAVVERQESSGTFALTNITTDQLHLFVARRYVDEPTRAALQQFIELKGLAAAADARVAAADRETREIAEDQKRLRENIEALTKTAEARQLIARYVQKADQQETRLEQLGRERQTAAAERQQLQTRLDALIRTLALEREI